MIKIFTYILLLPVLIYSQINWQKPEHFESETINVVFASETGAFFAGSKSNGIFISEDAGLSWFQTEENLNEFELLAFSENNSFIFAGTFQGGIFRSVDTGKTWTAINNGLSNKIVQTILCNDEEVFIGTKGGGVFYSENNGNSWQGINSQLKNMYVNSMVLANDTLYAGTDKGVFEYIERWNYWEPTYPILRDKKINSLIVDKMNKVFASADSAGIYRINKTSQSWDLVNNFILHGTDLTFNGDNDILTVSDYSLYNLGRSAAGFTPLFNESAQLLSVDYSSVSKKIIIGTRGDGLYVSDSIVTSVNNVDIPKNQISVYPNPFNNELSFHLINHRNFNSIDIYDLNGKKIDSLPVTDELTKWNPAKYIASGIYIYKIIGKNEAISGKAILIK